MSLFSIFILTIFLVRIFFESLVFEFLGPYFFSIFSQGIGLLLVMLSFVHFFITKSRLFIFPMNFYYFFLFVSLSSIVNSPSVAGFFVSYFKYFAMASMYILGYNMDYDSIVPALRKLIYFSFIPIFYGFFQYFTGRAYHFSNFWGESFDRIYSTFSHPNQYAFYLSITILLLSFLLINKKINLFFIIYIFPLIGSLILTYSRSSILSLFVCMIILTILIKPFRKYSLLIVFFVIVFMSPYIIAGFKNIIAPEPEQLNSLDFRLQIASDLINIVFSKHPFLGFGPGSSEEVASMFTNFGFIPPHNDYVKMFVETGFFGFTCFIIYVFAKLFYCTYSLRYTIDNIFLVFYALITFYTIIVMYSTNSFSNITAYGYSNFILGMIYKLKNNHSS